MSILFFLAAAAVGVFVDIQIINFWVSILPNNEWHSVLSVLGAVVIVWFSIGIILVLSLLAGITGHALSKK